MNTRPSHRWTLVVVLAFAALHLPSVVERYEPNSWLYGDGAFYFTTVRAITEQGTIEQKALQSVSWYEQNLSWNRDLTDDWSNVALGRNGGWYPKHPVLLPVLALPLYLLYGTVGTLLTNVLLNLLFILLVFRLARRVARVEMAAVAAILVAAQPFVLRVSYSFSNDILGADLLLGAIECVLLQRAGAAGVLAGLSIWARMPNVTFVPALMAFGYAAGGWPIVWRAVRFTALPLGAFALWNTWFFGAPWVTSYHAVLVREEGITRMAAHTRLFNTSVIAGARKMFFGERSISRAFPILFPALIGLWPLLRRHRALGVAFALALPFPIAFYLPYDWYNERFLYPLFGLFALPVAASLSLLIPADTTPPLVDAPTAWRPTGRILGLVALAIVVSAGVVRAVTWRSADQLSSHLEQAKVFVDQTPCDYFNPQQERWECSHIDDEAWAMTGRTLRKAVRVKGRPTRGIWLHPSPSGVRRLVFEDLPGSQVALTGALGDDSHAGVVEIEVLARGQSPFKALLTRGGDSFEHVATWTAPAQVVATGERATAQRPALEIRVQSKQPAWKHVVLKGRLK